MATAVRNAVSMLGLSVVEASAMAATVPAAFLSLNDRGGLRPGARADLAWLDGDLQPRGTWIGGQPCAAN
jgi:N-acetylglucosamine-6-phosphate deacetylase